MSTNLASPEPTDKCFTCGAPIWRAIFGAETRAVELAPLTLGPAGLGRKGLIRRGHVALTFPLIPGEPIRGSITRRLTRYRVHKHTAFSAASFAGKRGAA
jgi:hypothetical protein